MRVKEFSGEWEEKRSSMIFDKVRNSVDVDIRKMYKQIGIRSHGKGIFYKDKVLGKDLGNKRVFWVESNVFIVNIVFAWERAIVRTTEKESVKTSEPGNYLIVTEGTETEVNYFNGIKEIIEHSFRNNIIVDKVSLKVEGTGRSTKVLVNKAIKKRSLGAYSEVWAIFDKDENEDFDEAINFAKKEGLNVAWSNECFELWLLLHFQNLEAAISRTDYYSKLSLHFKKGNFNKGIYDKNIKEIFYITSPFIDEAVKISKLLISNYTQNTSFCPSKMNPCTTVQELVEELIQYTKATS